MNDCQYFRHRAEQEAIAAATSSCIQARAAHLAIAKRYAELARELEVLDRELVREPNIKSLNPTYVGVLASKHVKDRTLPRD